MKFSLAQQIEEIDRELALRKNVYARRVAGGAMRQSVAEFHTERLQAVKLTLEFMREHEEAIRDYIKAKAGKAA